MERGKGGGRGERGEGKGGEKGGGRGERGDESNGKGKGWRGWERSLERERERNIWYG